MKNIGNTGRNIEALGQCRTRGKKSDCKTLWSSSGFCTVKRSPSSRAACRDRMAWIHRKWWEKQKNHEVRSENMRRELSLALSKRKKRDGVSGVSVVMQSVSTSCLCTKMKPRYSWISLELGTKRAQSLATKFPRSWNKHFIHRPPLWKKQLQVHWWTQSGCPCSWPRRILEHPLWTKT